MKFKYIDIHSHISFADYGKDQKDVLKRMNDLEMATITVGTDLVSSIEAVKIASENENVFACIGAHPHDVLDFVFREEDFKGLVQNPKVVAIGECGLDYFKMIGDIDVEKARQKNEFIKQIEFAIKYNKALMLHIRDAYDDAYNILKKYEGKVRGNIHFFAGSLDWARKFNNLGFTVSFTGVITFADQYDEVVKNIPLNMLHAETDAPYVAPIPYRGKRNEPAYVVETIKRIAEIRGEDFESVRIQLLDNAKRVFGIQ